MTVLELASALGLSHTAIAKVIRELLQKNVVQISDNIAPCFGRPPKIYCINSACAITCAVMINSRSIYIYYVDMRGFQINCIEMENNFTSAKNMISVVAEKIRLLRNYPYLIDKEFKYIYIGIPTEGVCQEDFITVKSKFDEWFGREFQGIQTVVQCNTNYQLFAELKYGTLCNKKKNALLIDFGRTITAALFLNGNVYQGDYNSQGQFEGVEPLEGNVDKIENTIKSVIKKTVEIIRFLDIHNVVFSGIVKNMEWFMPFVKKEFGDGVACYFSTMGKNVPPALSGAVWQATYSTLMKVIVRQ